MDKYTPSEWSVDFVRGNVKFCASFLDDTFALAIGLLKKGGSYNCSAACVGLNQIMNGAETMQRAGVLDARPFLCTNSFSCGVIMALGCTDFPEDERRSGAISAFLDCKDFSNGGLTEYCDIMLEMLESGMAFSEIKNRTFPDFPNDLIEMMQR